MAVVSGGLLGLLGGTPAGGGPEAAKRLDFISRMATRFQSRRDRLSHPDPPTLALPPWPSHPGPPTLALPPWPSHPG
ncbi:MAG: hypothetical protein K9H18_23620, partial [Rhodospirillum sp.]|nr:hypothetical protein [Rhodospirillum sp.]